MANVKVAEVALSERSVSSVKTGSLNLLRFLFAFKHKLNYFD